jgi:cyanophycinase-like exopeptidase
MGGASEQDDAMIWFLERAGGGDILVLRASGADGYNNYLYTDLGVPVNSVETIVCNSAAASNETYVQDRIKEAEAIWFAGGDQWAYISYWRNTPVDSLINEGLAERNLVIGGTSAGMAIQGGYYFSAENGTITSANALSNPFNTNLTVSGEPFLQNNYLEHVVTDTHYDNPDRKGRHFSFLARMLNDAQIEPKGIACDEYTAVCITPEGIAHVFGDEAYDDIAYFIQVNCEINSNTPEMITSGSPLTWNQGNAAVKTYVVYGTQDGSRTFDLNDWNTGNGGAWENWHVENGTFFSSTSTAPNCSLSAPTYAEEVHIYPNPASEVIYFSALEGEKRLMSLEGKYLMTTSEDFLSTQNLPNGIYFIEFSLEGQTRRTHIQVIH